MDLSFRGANYHGWQIQPNDTSVQGTIENALHTILRCQTPVTGAGRTDTGVNAKQMVAHLDLDLDPQNAHKLIRPLNAICRPDIVVNSITPVHGDAHARFDATNRTYRYYAHTADNPFIHQLSWRATPGLDFEAMNQAAQHLLGTQDFTSFSKLHSDTKTNICSITHAQWHTSPIDPSIHYFEVSADRFLRNMVRAIVGTLVMVGTHKIAPDEITDIIAQKSRNAAGTSMPPHPLFLWNINYPFYNPVKP